jgi:hypothetical protein
MEAESFFLPGRKQKEVRRDDPSIIATGLYGRLDRQWQFNEKIKQRATTGYIDLVMHLSFLQGALRQ